jgi:hypothetical protein
VRARAFAVALGAYLLPIGLMALGACVGTTFRDESRTAAVAVAGDRLVLSGARAFAAAELAYITAADGAGRLARASVLRGESAARVRRWNGEARRVLARGHAAIDGAAKARAAAELFTLADRIGAAGK